MRLIIVSMWLGVSGQPLDLFQRSFVIRFQTETKETCLANICLCLAE